MTPTTVDAALAAAAEAYRLERERSTMQIEDLRSLNHRLAGQKRRLLGRVHALSKRVASYERYDEQMSEWLKFMDGKERGGTGAPHGGSAATAGSRKRSAPRQPLARRAAPRRRGAQAEEGAGPGKGPAQGGREEKEKENSAAPARGGQRPAPGTRRPAAPATPPGARRPRGAGPSPGDAWAIPQRGEGAPAFRFREVVRNKEAREHMRGCTCTECAQFIDALYAGGAIDSKSQFANLHSRHRYSHTPPPETPEDYWRLSFADEASPS